jgi:formylglycine-generating enzyme required for sulfatase activity
MSKKIFFGTMFLLGLSMLALTSCDKDKDKDDETQAKPVISNLKVGTVTGEEPDETIDPWVVAGQQLYVEAEIAADGKIARIDVEFNKGSGDNSALKEGSGNNSPLKVSYATGKYIGVKNAVFQEHIDIPASSVPGEGYDLHFSVTDMAGQTSAEKVEGLEVRAAIAEIPSLTVTVAGVTFKMVEVVGGAFTMGASEQDPEAYDIEKPAHSVTVSDYYIGETEVTQALWRAVMGSNPSHFTDDNNPVETVSWEDITGTSGSVGYTAGSINYLTDGFFYKLSVAVNGGVLGNTRYTLPTEAEWEYAARGGNRSNGYKYSGSNNLDDVAWYYKENDTHTTRRVAQKTANELGLYDMTGNVWEWTTDLKDPYVGSVAEPPVGDHIGHRVIRGGSFDTGVRNSRVSYRDCYPPDGKDKYFGLRLVLRK